MQKVKLAYTVHQLNPLKSNRPLVIIPGLFGSRQNWQSIGKVLSRDLERPVYALDMRNHGDSPWTLSHTYDEMGMDVESFVEEVCGVHESVDVMGHSMGGKVAMLLALKKPSWLGKSVIVDMSPVNQSSAITSLFAGYVDAMKTVDLHAAHGDKKVVDRLLDPNIPELAVRQFLLTNLRKRSNGLLEWRINLDTLGAHLNHLWTFPVQDPRQSKYEGPVMFVKGARSNYISNDTWPAIQQYFPNSELQTIERAGHWVHSDNPKDFMEKVSTFLSR